MAEVLSVNDQEYNVKKMEKVGGSYKWPSVPKRLLVHDNFVIDITPISVLQIPPSGFSSWKMTTRFVDHLMLSKLNILKSEFDFKVEGFSYQSAAVSGGFGFTFHFEYRY